MALHQDRRSKLQLFSIRLVEWHTLSHNTYVYILCLRREDNTYNCILCTDLPITATLADKWLHSLTILNVLQLMDMITYVGADYVCHVMVIHFTQKVLRSTKSSSIDVNGFRQYHMTNSAHTWLHCNS